MNPWDSSENQFTSLRNFLPRDTVTRYNAARSAAVVFIYKLGGVDTNLTKKISLI